MGLDMCKDEFLNSICFAYSPVLEPDKKRKHRFRIAMSYFVLIYLKDEICPIFNIQYLTFRIID